MLLSRSLRSARGLGLGKNYTGNQRSAAIFSTGPILLSFSGFWGGRSWKEWPPGQCHGRQSHQGEI